MRIHISPFKFLGLVLTGIIICTGVYTPQIADAAPEILIEQKEFKFKPTIDGAEIVHDYIVKNTGDEELQITNVKPG